MEMEIQVGVKNQSIESSGITSDYKDAICEYIWNGLEAHATEINISYSNNVAFGIDELTISDNGDGIDYNDLMNTFGAFLASQKNQMSLQMKSKVNKGKGRFSFTAFSSAAKWSTVYNDGGKLKKFDIVLNNEKKEIVNYTEPIIVDSKVTGTVVSFSEINNLTVENMSFQILEPILLREFAWFLYLSKNKNVKICINNIPIDYSKYINTDYSEKTSVTIDNLNFEINLIVWKESIKEKYCCYYFDSKDSLKGKDTTTFNRNTIGFTHSVYIKSKFFDKKEKLNSIEPDEQINLFTSETEKKIFKELKKFITYFIEKKIGTFLSQKAEQAVKEMISERRTFPQFSNDAYGQMRKRDLENVTKELYKLEPHIFYKLKPIQEKSFLAFLNLLLSSEEREQILEIVEQIVKLSPEQRRDFADILKKTKLENVVDSIKFIEERYKVIELLRTIVYELTKYANERDHIQKIVEHHFWLFGEQFALASADQRMRVALEKYTNILYGENNIEAKLNRDMEQERRMDIFLCNTRNVETSFGTIQEENIIVELKAPKVPLSKKVLRQIEDYMDFVKKQPAFNSEFRKWKFIAVCREVDADIRTRYETFKDRGKVGLVSQVDSYEVYAYTWDDVFKSFELRHAPILKRLNYDRDILANELLEEVKTTEERETVDSLTMIATSKIENVI